MKTSKLCLGTVQFGIPYGISNKNGQTSEANAANIMNYAYENGVTTLDTACSYGNSEEVIGKVIGENNWDIITKTPHFLSNRIDNEHLDKLVFSFKKSIDKIGRKSLYGLMIHSCDDLFKPGGRDIFFELKKLQSLGLIKKIGVSVYTKDQILRVLDNFDIDLIQLPINILDQRLIHSGCLEKLKKKGVEIHARSVFLQGLLLMPLNMIPDYFSPIIKNIKNFNEDANSLSMTALELALNYVVSIHEVDRVIVGVNTVQHIEDITSCKFKEITLKDFRGLSVKDPNFLNPSLWPSW